MGCFLMREISLYLRDSVYGGVVVDDVNVGVDHRVPVIVRGQGVVFDLRLFSGVGCSVWMSASDLSVVASTWVLNVSPVADNASPVCLRSDSFDVLSDGCIRLVVGCTDTVESSRVIGRLVRAIWVAELCGFPAGGIDPSVVLRFRVCYENRVFGDQMSPVGNVSLFYTRAQVDSLLADLGGSVPHASVVSHGTVRLASCDEVAGGVGDGVVVSSVLGPVLDGKVDVDRLPDIGGKEDVANKAADFDVVDDIKYPSVKAVKNFAQNETLTELTGADVTVAPWTQSKWSASGTCTLTATGWAASGHQVAYVLITLDAEATLAVSGATVDDDDALSAAGTYACYLINEDGTVRFKVANFTEAA